MVTYTPETYSVKYGHKENVTDFTSITVNGTTDIHIKNVPYLVELEGLQPNTTYYYYVLASNSNGSTASITKSFTTPPPSEIIFMSSALSPHFSLYHPVNLLPCYLIFNEKYYSKVNSMWPIDCKIHNYGIKILAIKYKGKYFLQLII